MNQLLKDKIDRFLDLECHYSNDKNFDQERFDLKRDIKIIKHKLKGEQFNR